MSDAQGSWTQMALPITGATRAVAVIEHGGHGCHLIEAPDMPWLDAWERLPAEVRTLCGRTLQRNRLVYARGDNGVCWACSPETSGLRDNSAARWNGAAA